MTPAELEHLRGLPHLAVTLYVLGLRPLADDAGQVDGATWPALAAACAVVSIPGQSGGTPSVAAIRRAWDRLRRAGMLRPAARPAGGNAVLTLVSVDRPAARPAGSEVRPAARPAGGNVGGERAEGDRPAVRPADTRHVPGSPSSPPPNLPLKPPLVPPPSPPPPPDARACDPPFALEAQPGEEPEPQRVAVIPANRGRIPEHWTPTPGTMKAIAQRGLAVEEARREIGAFVVYWSGQGGQTAFKSAEGWQRAFLNWCSNLIERKKKAPGGPGAQGQPATGGQHGTQGDWQRQRDLGVSGRQAERIREHFGGQLPDIDPDAPIE